MIVIFQSLNITLFRIQESTGGLFEDEKEYDYSEEEEF
jgi:hypothetical protein